MMREITLASEEISVRSKLSYVRSRNNAKSMAVCARCRSVLCMCEASASLVMVGFVGLNREARRSSAPAHTAQTHAPNQYTPT